jgi:hypothetical protein
MPAADSVMVLRFGPGNWLRAVHFFVSALGVVAILLTPSGLDWQLGALSSLVLVSYLVHAVGMSQRQSGWIELLQDGSAQVRAQDGQKHALFLSENAWVIRWLCVVTLFEPDSRKRYHYVVCATENSLDEYRRLLMFLKMRSSTTHLEKARWW